MAYVCVDDRLVRYAHGQNRKPNGKTYPVKIEICRYGCEDDNCRLAHPNRHGVDGVEMDTRYCFNGCMNACMFPGCAYNHHRTCEDYIDWYNPRAGKYQRSKCPCKGHGAVFVHANAPVPEPASPPAKSVPELNEKNFPAATHRVRAC